MPFYGSIVIIRRSEVDGSIFPLVSSECLIGRAEGCEIRVQLPTVSRGHCRISVNQSSQVLLTCLSHDFGQTKINTKNVNYNQTLVLRHKDIFTIGDRSFRWEYPEESEYIAVTSPKKVASKAVSNNELANAANYQPAKSFVTKKLFKYDTPSSSKQVSSALNISTFSESNDRSDSEIAFGKSELESENRNVDSLINQKVEEKTVEKSKSPVTKKTSQKLMNCSTSGCRFRTKNIEKMDEHCKKFKHEYFVKSSPRASVKRTKLLINSPPL